jgi:hypothetical protein
MPVVCDQARLSSGLFAIEEWNRTTFSRSRRALPGKDVDRGSANPAQRPTSASRSQSPPGSVLTEVEYPDRARSYRGYHGGDDFAPNGFSLRTAAISNPPFSLSEFSRAWGVRCE